MKLMYVLLLVLLLSGCLSDQMENDVIEEQIILAEPTTNLLNDINEVIAFGDMDRAEEMYLLELEKQPNNEGIKEGLGFLYLSKGEKEKAKSYLSYEIIEGYVNNSIIDVLNNINEVIASGDMDKAEEMYLLELGKDPNNEGIKEGLGYLYLAIGERSKAKKYLSDEIINGYVHNTDINVNN